MLKEKNIQNIIIYTAPNFVGYALSVITIPIMTRLLRPADYGIIIMANLFPAIAVGLLTFGLVSATQRNYFQYRKDKEQLNGLIMTSQVFLFLMLIASSIGVYLLRDNISQMIIGKTLYGNAIFVAYLAAYLAYINSFYLTIFQSMERAKLFAGFIVTQTIMTSGLNLLYVWAFKLSFMGPLLGALTANVCLLLVLFVVFNSGYSYKLNFTLLFENILFGLQLVPKVLTGF
ncbi:MAG: oligosaccharide flippase family protein, partial [Candidatus Margulisbacteria bacterium]|nr:oligosaccharide flippase family protein [Candidatus Margulisiibacteriota bacterium]